LAQGEVAIDTSAVSLYKAFGGGWQACGDDTCSGVAQSAAGAEPEGVVRVGARER
jgi:multidrug efflux system outer membrane protein